MGVWGGGRQLRTLGGFNSVPPKIFPGTPLKFCSRLNFGPILTQLWGAVAPPVTGR